MSPIAHLNEVTFNQAWCYNFAPHPGGREAIADVLRDFDEHPCLGAYFFSRKVQIYGDNLKPPASFEPLSIYDPSQGMGGGLMDEPQDHAANLDFNAKLDAGHGFAILSDGSMQAFEFPRNSPAEIFGGLCRHFIDGHRYNLTLVDVPSFRMRLLPEDQAKFSRLACMGIQSRQEMMRQSIFDWLIAKRQERVSK